MRKFIASLVLTCLTGLFLGSCTAPSAPVRPDNKLTTVPSAVPARAPIPTPTLQTIIIHSGKSSLPATRQMLGDRPPGAPLPTPTKEGLDFSKDVPISNAPGQNAQQISGAAETARSLKPKNGRIDFTTHAVVISNAPRATKR